MKTTYEKLDEIPFELKADQVLKGLRLRQSNATIERMVRRMVEEAADVARPKAIYAVSAVSNKHENWLEIDGVKFTSRIMRVNFDQLNRVFPYVVTCGTEVDAVKAPDGDLLGSFCLDAIKVHLMGTAMRYMTAHVKRKFDLGKTSFMNPGSLADWPITQQRPLFSLFPDVEKAIGVRLTPGCMMQPLKSGSGIMFTTETGYENCQFCPREDCPGRRALYDPAMFSKYA